MPPLPNEARLPEPVMPVPRGWPGSSPPLDEREIFGKAAVAFEQLKRDREEAQAREAQLKIELTEATLAHESDRKKIGFLELENAQLRNDLQTLQSQVNDYRTFLSLQKKTLDAFNIKAPEKKPRAPKPKKENGEPKPAEEPKPEASHE